jgi:flagellar motor switch protein FliN/FliY
MAETQQAQQEETIKDQATEADKASGTEAKTAEFEQVKGGIVPAENENLDILLDISMPVTVNLGKTVVPFKQLLQMGPGSVLQLDKIVGKPAELFVQDIKFATCDIVVVDGFFAVRIKDILGAELPEQSDD